MNLSGKRAKRAILEVQAAQILSALECQEQKVIKAIADLWDRKASEGLQDFKVAEVLIDANCQHVF